MRFKPCPPCGVLGAIITRGLADIVRSFGWYRAEIISALVNGCFLLGMALLVIWMGAMRLGDPMHLPAGPMLWVAFGAVTADLRAQDGVLDVHHIHATTLIGGKHAFSAHLRHGRACLPHASLRPPIRT